MAHTAKDTAARQIQTLYRAGALGSLTDGELLEQFVAGHEAEAAFEVLVERHGPIVLAACRSLLRDLHEADDAFQATFLVLARRAGSIRNQEAVASWLYGVAARIALRARAEATRRRTLARYLTERNRQDDRATVQPHRDEMPEVFEEVARLPKRYRAPIVLCYLECQSHEQAARILHCKVTTLQTRLLRAKAKLRVRLARRGLAPAVGFLAGGAASTEAASVVSGALPDALAGSTARAAARYAAASSAEIKTTILAMAQQALTALLWNRLSHTVRLTACLVAGMVLTGIVMLLTTAKKPDEAVKAITGRVLDARGGPIAGAQVWLQANFDDTDRSTARATTDAQGRYTLVLPDVWFQTPPHQRSSVVWAYAADHQIATANSYKALLSAEPEPVDLTLGPATDTTFVVMGPDGRPLAGAVVEPYHFKTPRAYEFPPRTMLPLMRTITDDAGRARLPALPREGLRAIQVTSEALGSQRLRIIDAATEPARRTVHLRAAGRVEGRIVGDKPEWAAGVTLYFTTEDSNHGIGEPARAKGGGQLVTRADGSFTIPVIATGRLSITGRVEPTLPARLRFPDALEVRTGQTTHAEIPLVKGIRVGGVIRVKDSGEPVPGAAIAVSYGAAPTVGNRRE